MEDLKDYLEQKGICENVLCNFDYWEEFFETD